ncbi:MAG TPA: alpha/beta hydrolase, partial [Pirellulales bacterium]
MRYAKFCLLLLIAAIACPWQANATDDDTKIFHDLEYAEASGQKMLLDLYVPKDAAGPLPVIVWFHGGGWRATTKEPCKALPLVSDGYAIASVEYRLSKVAPFPAQIEDCKAAIRWLRAHAEEYHLDPKRFGAFAQSFSGGYLAALVGTAGNVSQWDKLGGNLDQSSRVQAVCEWYGAT